MGFAAERAMAEQALSNYERDEPAEPVFPPAAERIRRARQALGLTQEDVARRWGEQTSMYWDLELFDDEAFTANLALVRRVFSALDPAERRRLMDALFERRGGGAKGYRLIAGAAEIWPKHQARVIELLNSGAAR